MRGRRALIPVTLMGLVAAGATACAGSKHAVASSTTGGAPAVKPSAAPATAATAATPIKHLVVIFQENVSFDHYFATYPVAANPSGEPAFTALPTTPAVNGLSQALRTHNPNSANPERLDRSQALTCDQNHNYAAEQKAFDHGLMDRFVQSSGVSGKSPDHKRCTTAQVMDYFDGNTVTALWNYAQRFAMSDSFFGTTFGPSTPGALNLVSGQTHGVAAAAGGVGNLVVGETVIGDPDPMGDQCATGPEVRLTGTNIGELLTAKQVTWGWFEGGFHSCAAQHAVGIAVGGNGQWGTKPDYIAHHEPFQYYAATANLKHLRPSSVAAIGTNGDRANHQYDLADFWAAVDHGNQPAVSFLKAPGYQDGHPGYSDPIDEQRFLVDTVNRLQRASTWADTAAVIAYDDSDGWYDHQSSPSVNRSDTNKDFLTTPGHCGPGTLDVLGGYAGRCGYGPRLPLLVLSPFAKADFVDHTPADQSSILRFIEDNWGTGRIGGWSFDAKAGSLANLFDFSRPNPKALVLDPATGQPTG